MTVRIVGCPWPQDESGLPVPDRMAAVQILNARVSELPAEVLARIGVLARTSPTNSLVSSRLGRAWLREAVSCVFADRLAGLGEVEVAGHRYVVAADIDGHSGLACDAVESLSLAGICVAGVPSVSAVA
ncbi:MAG TPA: hypothetical protein VFA11_11095 [Acidimicrobiales bacterium]|nr:hypothetical protein [Acidimicrobiales bacterium]